MSSSIVKPTNRGTNVGNLPLKQQVFIQELLANDSFNGTEAAKAAGYNTPSQTAYKLLKQKKIQRAIGKALQIRMDRCQLKADDVLGLLRDILFFNPLEWFIPGPEGWTITDPKSLPAEIGRLIDGIEVRHRVFPDGTEENYFKVTLISKSTALTLAMRHCGIDGIDKQEVVHKMGWDGIFQACEEDLVEKRIREVENTNQEQ